MTGKLRQIEGGDTRARAAEQEETETMGQIQFPLFALSIR